MDTQSELGAQLSDEERMLVEVVAELARDRVAPCAAEIDRGGEYPWDLQELLARQGVLMMPFPVEYDGIGASELAIAMAIETLAGASAMVALILAMQQLGALPILLAGTEAQKRRYLPPLARGEWLVAYGLTEPSAGSDIAGIRARAVHHGDRYVLNGTKQFITNAGLARVNVVFAVTEPEAGARGMSAFVVEQDQPGFRSGKIEDTMGIRGSRNGELIFEDCAIPAANLLGREGDGYEIAMSTFDRSRIGIAAQALGIAQAALDTAITYARQRVQFGRPIIEHEGLQFLLADLATEVEAARLLTYHAARRIDAGRPPFTRETAMAKLYASNAAMRVTTEAVQILGGYGYTREYPVERLMRDAKITQIYEGTTQMQRLAIARSLVA
jgi:alkylation response protein AidB-like acyl-CoA dehydrogenase